MEIWLKMAPKKRGGGSLFRSFFATFSEGWFLDAFWSPLGSLLAPFWLPLAHFWLPLAHFWLPLAHFWLPLAPFWLTFGFPWLTFGALCFTFAHPGIHFLTFAISCPHFSYFLEFSTKISCKNLSFKQFSLQIRFSVNQIVFSRSAPNAPQQKIHPLFYNPSSRARSGTFASGNLD